MNKHLFFLLAFVCSTFLYSQKLVYKSNGTILNSENQKITPNQVRELLKDNEKLLADYNEGRSKKTTGNIMLIGGFGFLASDLLIGANADVEFPSKLTYIGIASLVFAIPVKIGFSKKIKTVVTQYNNQKATTHIDYSKQNIDFITNSNGVGFRLKFN